MVQALRIGQESVFLGQACALCKQEFGVGDEIVICPEDGARHHLYCWQANGNKCTAYGCRGAGTVQAVADGASVARPRRTPAQPTRPRVIVQEPESPPQTPPTRPRQSRRTTSAPPPPPPQQPYGSKVRTMPSGGLGCRHSCLVLGIIFAAVLLAIGCFGLYTIVQYVMEWYRDWNPQAPFDSAAAIIHALPTLAILIPW